MTTGPEKRSAGNTHAAFEEKQRETGTVRANVSLLLSTVSLFVLQSPDIRGYPDIQVNPFLVS